MAIDWNGKHSNSKHILVWVTLIYSANAWLQVLSNWRQRLLQASRQNIYKIGRNHKSGMSCFEVAGLSSHSMIWTFLVHNLFGPLPWLKKGFCKLSKHSIVDLVYDHLTNLIWNRILFWDSCSRLLFFYFCHFDPSLNVVTWTTGPNKFYLPHCFWSGDLWFKILDIIYSHVLLLGFCWIVW